MNKNKKFIGKNKSGRKEFHKEKSYDKNNTRESHGFKIPEENDYKWYAPTEEIAEDLASIPFNVIGGMNFPLEVKQFESNVANSGRIRPTQVLPSVMRLEYVLSVGRAQFATDGINMAAVQLYTKIRSKNSGAKNYEAPDVTMYVLALREIYAAYFHVRKIIGLVNVYNFFNHNIPLTFLKSLRIDVDDLRSNIANYRAQLNTLAAKVNSFAVPKYFKAFYRDAFIASTVFADSDSKKGQFYIFDLVKMKYWSGTSSVLGTSLNEVAFVNSENINRFVKLQRYIDVINGAVDSLFFDSDALTMSGDILKAFEDSEMYALPMIDEGVRTDIIYDENILNQIQNSYNALFNYDFTMGGVEEVEIPHYDISQRDQLIQVHPQIVINQNSEDTYEPNFNIMNNTIFNSHKDKADYKDVLEWSRLISTFTFIPYGGGVGYGLNGEMTSTGLEAVTKICIYSLEDSFDDNDFVHYDNGLVLYQMIGIRSYALDKLEWLQTMLSRLSQFDWHPFIYFNKKDDANATPHPTEILGDVKNATVISTEVAKRINDSAIYATFNKID